MKKALSTLAGIVIAAACVAIGAFAVPPLLTAVGWGATSDSRDSQVMGAIQRTEEISLVSLGIQGILEESKESTFLGVKVPGSKRLTLMQYGFTAKLGIDGAGVEIEPTGEDAYRISFPEFIFIGHDNASFKVAAEDNGLLSWATPEIDTIAMVNEILTEKARSEYLSANEDLLKEQATAFYTSIIRAVDPAIELEFVFNRTA